MTKADLITAVAQQTGNTKVATAPIVEAVFDEVKNKLLGGERVHISGFGSFETKDKPERMGVNPKTKEKIKIAASKVVKFKLAKDFKDSLK